MAKPKNKPSKRRPAKKPKGSALPILKNAGKRAPKEPKEGTLEEVLQGIPKPFDLADRRFLCPREPDRQTIRTILNFVRLGAPTETAAGALGLSSITLRVWLQRGVKDAISGGDTACSRLAMGILAARNQAEIAEIIKLRKGDDMAKFVLERRYPKNWSPKSQAEIEVNMTEVGSEKPEKVMQPLTPEEAAALTILYGEFVATNPEPKEGEPLQGLKQAKELTESLQ